MKEKKEKKEKEPNDDLPKVSSLDDAFEKMEQHDIEVKTVFILEALSDKVLSDSKLHTPLRISGVKCNCLTKTPTPKYHDVCCPVYMQCQLDKAIDWLQGYQQSSECPCCHSCSLHEDGCELNDWIND